MGGPRQTENHSLLAVCLHGIGDMVGQSDRRQQRQRERLCSAALLSVFCGSSILWEEHLMCPLLVRGAASHLCTLEGPCAFAAGSVLVGFWASASVGSAVFPGFPACMFQCPVVTLSQVFAELGCIHTRQALQGGAMPSAPCRGIKTKEKGQLSSSEHCTLLRRVVLLSY